MKKKLIASFLAVAFLLCMLTTSGIAFAEGEKELRILFTHDTHSSLLPYNELQADGSVKNVSGYARLATAIEKERTPNTVLLHAGDYAMGTFFNTIYTTHAPDLSLIGAMGYDAFTFGNHEFDFGPAALAQSLRAAKAESDRLPVPVCSNIQFPSDVVSQELKAAYESLGGSESVIIEKNGVKIGLFGILSKGAVSFTATATPITFEDDYKAAKRAVAALKDKGADIVICLSHGGTNPDVSKSEDNQLAKKVPGIDVIISGHTHSTLEKPIKEGKTTIVSAGYYARFLGELDVTITSDGIDVKDYNLVPIDDTVAENADIAAKVESYKAQVQSEYLDINAPEVKFDGIAAYSPFNFTPTEVIDRNYGNYGLANLITDGYLNEAKTRGIDATISVINSGIIRSSFLKGDVSEHDSYKALSLGTGLDSSVGFPLVEFFITGEELRALCEVDVSVYPLMNEAQLFFSGVRYKYNQGRLVFNKVYEVETQNIDGSWAPLDNEKLYGVMGSLYLGQMAGLITDTSFGILKIEPKDKNGVVLADINKAILHDSNGNEIKEWLSLSHYLGSFDKDMSGISQIPLSYQVPREGKIGVTGLSTLFINSTNFARIVYIIIIALVLIIALIILVIVRKLMKKKNRRGYVFRSR